MAVAELEKTLSSFPVMDSVVSLLDGVVEKLSALKRKVSWKQDAEHEVKLHKNHTLPALFDLPSRSFRVGESHVI